MDKAQETLMRDRGGRCAIAVMAKAPAAGRMKTRLSPVLDPEEARDLGCCFLKDMTGNLAAAAREVPLDPFVAFAPAGSEAALASTVEAGTGFVLADGSAAAPPGVEGLGRCLLQAAGALLELGYGAVGLLNSDSPTLPTSYLVQAVRRLLEPGERAMLGSATDGGYYFIGMKQAHANLFRVIDWSTAEVARQTRRRADEIGLELIDLAAWYDVDDVASLRRLLDDLAGKPRGACDPPRYPAPTTAAWLQVQRIGVRLGEEDASGARPAQTASAP